jgi:hypothetical protein
MSRKLPRRLQMLGTVCALAATLSACAGTEPAIKPSSNTERSKAAFMEMAKVLTHPRCLNCHAQGDGPTQGDAMALHEPPVTRGTSGMGAAAMRCNTCHGESNVTLAEHAGSVPGAPSWQLAPGNLAWRGKSPREICEQLKDQTRNGGLSLEDIYKRNSSDPLTGWAWGPGEGRTPAPGTQADFAKQTRAWIDDGAHCPGS